MFCLSVVLTQYLHMGLLDGEINHRLMDEINHWASWVKMSWGIPVGAGVLRVMLWGVKATKGTFFMVLDTAVLLLMEQPCALSVLLNHNCFYFFFPKPYVSVYRLPIVKVLVLTKMSFKRGEGSCKGWRMGQTNFPCNSNTENVKSLLIHIESILTFTGR